MVNLLFVTLVVTLLVLGKRGQVSTSRDIHGAARRRSVCIRHTRLGASTTLCTFGLAR
ncbi:hypothetical protein PGIGA_G00177130 [Pangasianodon gigas]|uniref:Uncharacterized protein n=1 Tax=Pangasianodon gigas TaxID=30993 RepID=A0ACC5XVA6_PANGG|nr:hypothetical protein [Pangasianodon gigas]